jgi:hypothetical protein
MHYLHIDKSVFFMQLVLFFCNALWWLCLVMNRPRLQCQTTISLNERSNDAAATAAERLVRIRSGRDSTGRATTSTRIDFKVVVDPLSVWNLLIMAVRPDRRQQLCADMIDSIDRCSLLLHIRIYVRNHRDITGHIRLVVHVVPCFVCRCKTLSRPLCRAGAIRLTSSVLSRSMSFYEYSKFITGFAPEMISTIEWVASSSMPAVSNVRSFIKLT